jgi:hypothetical protein
MWGSAPHNLNPIYIFGVTEILTWLAGESTIKNSILDGASSKKKQPPNAPLRVDMPSEAGIAATPESILWTQTAHERSVTLRHDRIAVAAYLIAEARGFESGHEAEDWLRAQAQIDSADSGAPEA